MKKSLIFIILFLLLLSKPIIACAGLFTMTMNPAPSSNANQQTPGLQEIPVQDNADKLIERRKMEAYKLINEGRALIKKGEQKEDQQLITRGQIKKEIGEKRLKLLKGQAEDKKKLDEGDGW